MTSTTYLHIHHIFTCDSVELFEPELDPEFVIDFDLDFELEFEPEWEPELDPEFEPEPLLLTGLLRLRFYFLSHARKVF